jgi:hypothetical protein
MKPLAIFYAVLTFALSAMTTAAQVTTSQYDNSRTGATLNEKTLTPQNVSAQHFGKLGSFKVDGAVYAQPLFVPGVEIPGKGRHDSCSSPPNTTAFTASMRAVPTIRLCGRSASLTPSAA